MQLTTRFKNAIKLAAQTQYQLALKVGLDPSSLSMMLHNGRRPRSDDTRLLKLGEMLGLSHKDIFEEDGNFKENK